MESVIERLREAWQAARTGRGGVIHLEGPVGSGKSTLLGRFLDAVGGPSERVAVVSARCGEQDHPRPGGRGVVAAASYEVRRFGDPQ
jgi:polynucleotide 5'-kinase involved in rRNA processing